jgi:ParB-like chromosome segregation protein Spo0J
VDLTDEEMALQGLAENLQRQGLNDMEKAEGIKRLVELISKDGAPKEEAYEEIKTMLGLKDTGWLKTFTGITEYTAPVKKLISERKIAARTAITAHGLGGDEMVKRAAKDELSHHDIVALSKSLNKIPDEKVKEKIKAKIIAGEITDPKEIEKKAEPMLRAKQEKGKPPPDLLIVIARWTRSIEDWRKNLKEVIPYRDYLDTAPAVAKEFREEVRGLIKDLEKLL